MDKVKSNLTDTAVKTTSILSNTTGAADEAVKTAGVG